ncbi:hypothetical protein DL98DRAFT_461279 [Cadophora sp. DSE1049]|nr:hypothetical protein DL98DRAFT_461279 [Cadophora sp. DSE1049]
MGWIIAWGIPRHFRRRSPREPRPSLCGRRQSARDGILPYRHRCFHSLHCLNAVRRELDTEYYSLRSEGQTEGLPPNHHDHSLWSKRSQRVHIDHCLNRIRQSLQCHPDLSPAAMKKHVLASGKTIYLGNAERHTCTDWSEIRQGVDERIDSGLGYWDE